MKENITAIGSLLYRMQKPDEKYEELKWPVSGTGGSYLYLLPGPSLQQNSGSMTRWCEPDTWGVDGARKLSGAI